MESNEHFQSLARTKKEADDYGMLSSPSMERIRFLWWMVWGILSTTVLAVIFATVWVVGVNQRFELSARDRDDLRLKVSANEAKIAAFEPRTKADDITHLNITNSLAAIQRELDIRAPAIDEVREMWFMKEHGISNKEDFQQRHGYEPPSSSIPLLKPQSRR